MSEFPFQKFINLVAFDQAINRDEDDLRGLDRDVDSVHDRMQAITHELELQQQKITASKKLVAAKELEMQTLDMRQKEKEKKLDQVSNQREYQTIQQEILTLKKKQYDEEEALLAAWHTLEIITKDTHLKQLVSENNYRELDQLMKQYEQKKNEVMQRLEHAYKERSGYEHGIPSEWLEKYAMMRRTVKNPVVSVVNGACSACFYTVLPHDMARLHKNALLQCKDCYRFLYMPSP